MPSTVGTPTAAEIPETVWTPTTQKFPVKVMKIRKNNKKSMKKSKTSLFLSDNFG
jgi:hypothetical protein